MKKIPFKILIIISVLFTNLFFILAQKNDFDKLQKLEQEILIKNIVGKNYVFDLTGKKGCNKTEIKYLGIAKTNKGKKYKILNSFFLEQMAICATEQVISKFMI